MDFDLNKLKVFYHVYETGSPTKTAKILHLTQSGVSQHIRHLEERIGEQLFLRSHKKLIPNQLAKELYSHTSTTMKKLEAFTLSLKEKNSEPEGLVRLGLPTAFSVTIVAELMADLSQQYPNLSFDMEFGEPRSIEPMLLDGRLDFAFTDDYRNDEHISLAPVFQEQLVLAGPLERIQELKSRAGTELYEALIDAPFLCYRDDFPVLKAWFRFHFKTTPKKITMRAKAFHVPTIRKLICHGAGFGILPLYIIRKDIDAKRLDYLPQKTELTNTIHIAHRKDSFEPRHVTICRDYFIARLKTLANASPSNKDDFEP